MNQATRTRNWLGFAIVAGLASSGASQAARGVDDGFVQIVSAEALAGSELRDQNLHAIGEIEFVIVRVSDGAAAGIAVDTVTGMDDRLVIVPWEALTIRTPDDEVWVSTTKDQFDKAPRVDRDQFGEITRPSLWRKVVNFWAPLQQASAGTAAKAEIGSGGAEPGNAPADAAGQESKAAAAPSEPGAQPEDTVAHVLVGRRIVMTVADPAFRLGEQFRGTEVMGADGEEIGEIAQLAIDIESDRVAYAVIAGGSFFETKWYAVPFGALSWSGTPLALHYTAGVDKLREMPSLDASRTPVAVPTKDLDELYRRFGAAPYWSARADASAR
jgi:sporulation protein YlmC with PRC-barrel domain